MTTPARSEYAAKARVLEEEADYRRHLLLLHAAWAWQEAGALDRAITLLTELAELATPGGHRPHRPHARIATEAQVDLGDIACLQNRPADALGWYDLAIDGRSPDLLLDLVAEDDHEGLVALCALCGRLRARTLLNLPPDDLDLTTLTALDLTDLTTLEDLTDEDEDDPDAFEDEDDSEDKENLEDRDGRDDLDNRDGRGGQGDRDGHGGRDGHGRRDGQGGRLGVGDTEDSDGLGGLEEDEVAERGDETPCRPGTFAGPPGGAVHAIAGTDRAETSCVPAGVGGAYVLPVWRVEALAEAHVRWPGVPLPGSIERHRRDVEQSARLLARDGSRVLLAHVDPERLAVFLKVAELPMTSQALHAYAQAQQRRGQVQLWPPGRNKPCWCGSHRKYKRCCARTSPNPPTDP